MTLEQELKQFRLSLGFDTVQFAEELGMRKQSISAYETGRWRASNEILDKINKKYGTKFQRQKPCIRCGQLFKNYGHEKLCGECAKKPKPKKKYPKKVKTKPIKPISVTEFNAQARQAKKTYGQLQAERYLNRIKEA